MEEIILTKGDAAWRQLVTAIELYFEKDDLASVHTLGAASLQVFDDLSKKTWYETLNLRERMYESVPSHLRKEFIDKFRLPQNFLKHADRNSSSDILTLKPLQTELVLLFGCFMAMPMRSDYCSDLKFPDLIKISSYMFWFYKKNKFNSNQKEWDNVMELLVKYCPQVELLSYSCSKVDFYKWVNISYPIILDKIIKYFGSDRFESLLKDIIQDPKNKEILGLLKEADVL